MLSRQLLAVFTLHDCLVFVVWVQREVVQVSERVKHKLSEPLDWEIVLIGNGIRRSLENVWLELGTGQTY